MSNGSQPASIFITLVRHGQTAANKARIIQGQADVPLNDTGRQQARCLRSHLETLGIKFDLIYTSDLIRALETCQIVAGEHGTVLKDELLRERAFGVVEGKTLEQYRAAAAEAGYNESNYSAFTPQGAEHVSEVNNRVRMFCANLLKVVEPGNHVLVVTHGGVIREFARYFRDRLRCDLNECEPMRATPNTGVNVFKIAYLDQKPRIAECLKMHDSSHLEGMSIADENPTSSNPGFEMTKFLLNTASNKVTVAVADNQRPDVVPLEAL